jgi:hemolysin III
MKNASKEIKPLEDFSGAAAKLQESGNVYLKDPGSAITHFIGMVFAAFAAFPLMSRGAQSHDAVHITALAVFIISMIMLYAASTLYHSLDLSETINRRLKKADHMMISVLIAGTYTPVCLIVLDRNVGVPLLVLVWLVAIAGMVIKAFFVYCPKWVSSILYISMGWLCLSVFPKLLTALAGPAFWWLLAGGIIYTVGGVIYALKLPIFNAKHKNFGSHEIFHLFVMGGSLCHFIMIYCFVA